MGNTNSLLITLLRPAVAFALRRGLKVRELLEVLKLLFLEEARTYLEESGEAVSVSRLAVMTGLQRRDVVRVDEGGSREATNLTLLTKLIGTWCGDHRFAKKGRPRQLTFEGVKSEFFELVSSVSMDISPYTLLFELERLGVVEKKGGLLVLRHRTLSLAGDSDESYQLLADDLADFVTAVQRNIDSSENIPNLHITTRYDNICLSKLPVAREWVIRRGAEFHAEIRKYLSALDKDVNPKLGREAGGGKITVGSFSLCEPVTHDEEHKEVI